jgi:hypothetical protein
MKKSENINELATALSKAQGEIKGALKDSANPFFKSTYSDLSSVMEAIRVPFAKHGLSFSQVPDIVDGITVIETIIMHSSGQWISGVMPVKCKDDSPQAMGSGVSYTKRYSLQSIAGVPSVDDDGQAAQNGAPKPTPKPYPSSDAQPARTYPKPGFGNK